MNFDWPLLKKKTAEKSKEVYEGTKAFPLLFDTSQPNQVDFTARAIVYTVIYHPELLWWYFEGSKKLERVEIAARNLAMNPDEAETILSELVEEFYSDYRKYMRQRS